MGARGIFAAALLLVACAGGERGLDALHADIRADYPGVAHVQADTVPNGAVVLDIRDPAEFAVSRLPGALRVDVDASTAEVLARAGDLSGRDVVVYCSVGRRSSIFAQRVQADLLASGAVSVSNLQGGIFRWHAQRRPLENARGRTDAVHPYDEIWRRYVPREDGVSYTPL